MPAPSQFIVVMGVSGCGKTTLAKGIAAAMTWDFAEGDDFHPQANVEKMRSGIALTDEDRWPWLQAIRGWIDDRPLEAGSAVLTCSALRRVYRDVLAQGRDDVRFAHVDAPRKVLEDRLSRRTGHYMPASLLDSQLQTLERLEPDENGVTVGSTGDPRAVLTETLEKLGLADSRE